MEFSFCFYDVRATFLLEGKESFRVLRDGGIGFLGLGEESKSHTGKNGTFHICVLSMEARGQGCTSARDVKHGLTDDEWSGGLLRHCDYISQRPYNQRSYILPMCKRELFNFGLKSLIELGRMGDIRNNDKYFFKKQCDKGSVFFFHILPYFDFFFSLKKYYFEQFLTASSILRTGKELKSGFLCSCRPQ